MKPVARSAARWRPLAAVGEQLVPMRDGVRLAADVYRPPRGRAPALLLRTPYGRRELSVRIDEVDPLGAVREGFAVVLQDLRGRGESQGGFDANWPDADDGADTVAWIRRQPWSDGRVAMVGASYSGCVQFQAAARRPDGLVAIAPTVSGALRSIWYPGGAPRLSGLAAWLTMLLRGALDGELDAATRAEVAELVDAPPLERFHAFLTPETAAWRIGAPLRHWVAAPPGDAFWTEVTAVPERPLPAIHTSGWYDVCVAPAVAAHAAWSAAAGPAEPQLLTLGPWDHGVREAVYPDIGLGSEQSPPGSVALARQVAFVRAVLGGGGVDELAPVMSYVLGRNRWHEDVRWPPAGVEPLPLSFCADRRLTRGAPGAAQVVRYRYDPRDPVPTLGGATAVWGRTGPLDQAPVEARADVLTFTSDAFDGELELAGSPVVRLRVASSAPATDFVARLALVRPDGRSFALVAGCWSGRLADLPTAGGSDPQRCCEIRLDPLHLALPRGARLRVQVTSSCFPELYPNPNTGHDLALGPPPRVVAAEQSVLVGAGGSSLVLPVRGAVPPEAGG